MDRVSAYRIASARLPGWDVGKLGFRPELHGPDQRQRSDASGAVLLFVMLVTAPALSMDDIPTAAEWSAALETG